MRSILLLSALGAAFAVPFDASARPDIFEIHANYRMINMRRHNDIQGVESVYDDYRRGWLKRFNSKIRLGREAGADADTPYCSDLDDGRAGAAKVCGGGHVFRLNATGFAATDDRDADTTDVGAITYAGYEYVFSNDMFLGLGLTYGVSSIEHKTPGARLEVDTADLGFHFLGGYDFGQGTMLAWNITYVIAEDDTTRNGGITGSYESEGLMITGVVYHGWNIDEDLFISLGLDYTFLGVYPQSPFIDSSGAAQTVPKRWAGDFTPSALLVQRFDGGEAFARLGVSAELINPTERPVDLTLDLGWSTPVADAAALTGSVGVTSKFAGFYEGRAALKLVTKF